MLLPQTRRSTPSGVGDRHTIHTTRNAKPPKEALHTAPSSKIWRLRHARHSLALTRRSDPRALCLLALSRVTSFCHWSRRHSRDAQPHATRRSPSRPSRPASQCTSARRASGRRRALLASRTRTRGGVRHDIGGALATAARHAPSAWSSARPHHPLAPAASP